MPIYCSSSTAIELTSLYRQHQEDGWFRGAVAHDPAAFQPRGLRRSPNVPKELASSLHPADHQRHDGAWLVAALLDRLAAEPWATIFFVGYQDPQSPGGLLMKTMGLLREGSRDRASAAVG